MGEEYTIRRMRRDEVDLALDWAAAEGWNPGLNDADCFYSADPEGFFIGLLDDEPVGCISVVAYGSSFGFLGLYIVRREFRGRGFGIRLWRQGMARLEGRNVGLDGVLLQQENYKRSGFQLIHRSARYQGTASGDGTLGPGIVPLSEVPFDELLRYDRLHFPDKRSSFLKKWVGQPDSVAFGFVGDEGLSGYGILRRCRLGFKMGPLFARDETIAELLFSALASGAEKGEPVFLDVPEPNRAALRLAEQHDMERIFETARMYTRGDPGLPTSKIFGVTTFELG
jgi:ribosomal protein S18 acetylase RimI-like enzyme